jgi:hypothetical protein
MLDYLAGDVVGEEFKVACFCRRGELTPAKLAVVRRAPVLGHYIKTAFVVSAYLDAPATVEAFDEMKGSRGVSYCHRGSVGRWGVIVQQHHARKISLTHPLGNPRGTDTFRVWCCPASSL